ncbi:beta-1,4-glucuronyltransferase 1-like [Stegodyphus dumicola]|uniref:beta-1,4-glucuronyltransferase 1-like n=1 Tax=Stegodyphus dumicola TaxID=202533 RepID=UPI0015AD7EFC|nr:beta-1,4-glucuronyltransferase 1-like [Stegodyphus dumicola]
MHKRRNLLLITFIIISSSLFYISVINNGTTFSSAIISADTYKITSALSEISTSNEAFTEECAESKLMYGNYCVLSPYSEPKRNIEYESLVTLSTQSTVEFLHHVPVLCQRWSGPISVAVYSPVDDYLDARRLVHALRHCDFCTRYWVEWHFFFQKQEIPFFMDTQLPQDCQSLMDFKLKKRRSQGIYPINVGRNIARTKTETPYVFSIDIELYPSLGILSKFERMVNLKRPSEVPQVWVVPVFEVHSQFRAPFTKSGLRSMYLKKQAISFHKYRCDVCHRIPNVTEWIQYKDSSNSEAAESLEPLKIWTTVKRNRHFRLDSWEPFFIGTREDPEFDIRLSWEGKQNKMQVAYEMCLMDYDFHIIQNAFLVHAPGINIYNVSEAKLKSKYMWENQKLMSVIKNNLIKKFGHKKDC